MIPVNCLCMVVLVDLMILPLNLVMSVGGFDDSAVKHGGSQANFSMLNSQSFQPYHFIVLVSLNLMPILISLG